MSEIIVLDYVVVGAMKLEYLKLSSPINKTISLASVLRTSNIELSSPINKTMNVSSEIELEGAEHG